MQPNSNSLTWADFITFNLSAYSGGCRTSRGCIVFWLPIAGYGHTTSRQRALRIPAQLPAIDSVLIAERGDRAGG
jgi:hypothetical protein